jgi:hypothetical protein
LLPIPDLPFVINKQVPVEELKEYALDRMNADRARSGLAPVKLSENEAVQAHAKASEHSFKDPHESEIIIVHRAV